MVLPIRVPNNVLLNFIWWHSSNYDRRWMIYASCYHHEHYEDYDDENSVLLVLNTWCIPCYMQVLLMSEVPSSYFHLIHLNGLWGCLSVMCSFWWHKESFKYNLLNGKQCCLKHVMHPMLRPSHSYLQSFEFNFQQTNASSCVAMAGSTHTISSTWNNCWPIILNLMSWDIKSS